MAKQRGKGGADRRDVLRVGATAVLAAAAGGERASAAADQPAPTAPSALSLSPPPAPPAPHGITTEMVAAAEKLAQVHQTDAERAQILNGLESQLRWTTSLRAVDKPNALAPATVFDPRLRGRRYPPQAHAVTLAGQVPNRLPDSVDDVLFAPVAHLSRWLATGQITSRRLTDLYLARIAALNPTLECFVTVTADLARAQADQADAERRNRRLKGPLHGVPYVLKDLADTRGISTTWGAVPFLDRVPDQDAVITERLREAGAILLGKTTLGEIAYGDIWFGGVTRNPWNPREGSSGSSAGTASAVAAGLAPFGIGTETLGSIISPSDRCGTAGLRPTFGRVARTGCMALCWSLDKIGPITRQVEDTALVLAALNGADDADPASIGHGFAYDGAQDAKGLTVGYDPAWFAGESVTEAAKAALAALTRLGVTLKPISLPKLDPAPLLIGLLAEAAAAFEELTLNNRDDLLRWQGDDAWPNAWRQARFMSAIDLVQADRLRRRFMEEMDRIFQGVDVIAGPSFAGDLLTITNFTGHPQLVLRAGFQQTPTRPIGIDVKPPKEPEGATHKVPVSFSLWAPLFEERRLIALGRLLEAELGVWGDRPSL